MQPWRISCCSSAGEDLLKLSALETTEVTDDALPVDVPALEGPEVGAQHGGGVEQANAEDELPLRAAEHVLGRVPRGPLEHVGLGGLGHQRERGEAV